MYVLLLQEMKIWLSELLDNQKGRSEDGRVPRPSYEQMWQVDVKEFKPDDAMNTFKMSGPHRFAVTGEDIRLFALGQSTVSETPFPFPDREAHPCKKSSTRL